MSAGFTPGPWFLGDDEEYDIIIGRNDEGCLLEGHLVGANSERRKANARLISAAPDLYEALEGLLARHPKGSWPPSCVVAFRALEKARGEAA